MAYQEPNSRYDLAAVETRGEPQRDGFLLSGEKIQVLDGHVADAIIVSASGILTGGGVIQRLKRLLPEERNKILLVGYQAIGTRGWRLQQGEEQIKMHVDVLLPRTISAILDHDAGSVLCSSKQGH